MEFSLMRTHDAVPKRRMAEALEAYIDCDDAFVREVFGSDTVVGRALVHETALGDDGLPEVLEWERATAILSKPALGAWLRARSAWLSNAATWRRCSSMRGRDAEAVF